MAKVKTLTTESTKYVAYPLEGTTGILPVGTGWKPVHPLYGFETCC
jgi:hypothetical protein